MKFLPESKNKQIVLVVVLFVALGGIIYVNFFMDKSDPVSIGEPLSPPRITAGSPAGSGAGGEITVRQASPGLLPYGSEIDMRVLDSDKFKKLNDAPALIVRPEELGKPDLFK